jgi:hypothetical protein
LSKIESYRKQLQALESWDSLLLAESNLPGPRANLELAFAVAEEGTAAQFSRYAGIDALEAPSNSPKEFLAFCGVLGLGYLLARGERAHLPIMRKSAADSRWRIREAVALGLQRFGQMDMEGLLEVMELWRAGDLLERRAVVAALCEPSLLGDPRHAKRVIEILDVITSSIIEEADRKSNEFKVLRKGLAYGWSIVVAAQPAIGKPRFEKWVGVEDPDIRWIVKQNLKKKRLSRMDEQWVQSKLEELMD